MYHLFYGKCSDIPNSDSDVEHLACNEVALVCPFESSHLYQNSNVPGGREGGREEGGGGIEEGKVKAFHKSLCQR